MDYAASASDTPSEPYVPKSWHVGHRKQEAFDKVTIEKNPRWKESYLSGDEWRFSASVVFYLKGVEVHRASYSDINTAAAWLPSILNGGLECNDEIAVARQAALKGKCDNPGCCNDAEFIHRLKKRYIGNEAIERPLHDGGEHRQFCARHKRRGDCAMDDADSNYTVEPISA